MVQYVFTPWRDRRELLTVRRQLYPGHHGNHRHGATVDAVEQQQQHAVARVSMWMQRGGCPHLVESTALLRAAILSDYSAARSGAGSGAARSSGAYAARAAYSAAFSRFVTGLLDSNQDKQHKMSMYAVAKSVGLPATFVELRHQATHEQLPSLTRLRAAAQTALDWIWEYYWRHLADDAAHPDGLDGSGGGGTAGVSGRCRKLVTEWLAAADAEARKGLMRELGRYEQSEVLRAVEEVTEQARDPKLLREALALSAEILQAGAGAGLVDEDTGAERIPKDIDAARSEISTGRRGLQEAEEAGFDNYATGLEEAGPSWSRDDESWIPKPIGVV